MLEPFDMVFADSVDHALRLKNEYGEDSSYYAGGTEIITVLKEGFLFYEKMINISRVPDLKNIEYDQDQRVIRIGALTTHESIVKSDIVKKYLPTLAQLEAQIGNVRIREAGTIAGNLAFAEPRSDPGAFLVAVDAKVNVQSQNGKRTINMSEFWEGAFETVLEEDELILSIDIPVLGKNTGTAYKKFSFSEFPMAGIAVKLDFNEDYSKIIDAKLVVAAANPIPTRLTTAENEIIGSSVTDVLNMSVDLLNEIIENEMDAVDDQDGSAEYKNQVVAALLEEAINDALLDAKEGANRG